MRGQTTCFPFLLHFFQFLSLSLSPTRASSLAGIFRQQHSLQLVQYACLIPNESGRRRKRFHDAIPLFRRVLLIIVVSDQLRLQNQDDPHEIKKQTHSSVTLQFSHTHDQRTVTAHSGSPVKEDYCSCTIHVLCACMSKEGCLCVCDLLFFVMTHAVVISVSAEAVGKARD